MHIDELDRVWLDSALREAGHLGVDTSVADVTATPFGVGVGMVGQLARLTITYDGPAEGLPTSLIAKLPSPYEANRAQMQLFRYYVREALFYREVAPTSTLRVPRCWWSTIDTETNLSALLLEDLGHLHSPDQIVGMSPALAERALRVLARFQAEWWQSPRLDEIPWMDYGNGPITMGAVGVFEQAWQPFLDNGFRAQLTPEQIELGAAVRDHFGQILTEFGGEPRTICHTDFRAENMFFGEPGSDDDVVVLDWQISTRSGGVYDVAYLLAQSLTVDDRRAHEERLLQTYHGELTANGVDLSWQDCLDAYRVGLMVCLVIPVSVGGTLDMANERGRQLVEMITARAFTAAIDQGCGELLVARYG
jgi:hypothetical protein